MEVVGVGAAVAFVVDAMTAVIGLSGGCNSAAITVTKGQKGVCLCECVVKCA